jgi:Shwachman-Bodian-Diamond syndrome (SBDS) protein
VNQTDQVIPSETDIDDVVQVNNVFINVSKGEVAKTEDLKKAFGKADREAIVREVIFTQIAFTSISHSRFEFRFFNEARFRLGTRSASMSFPPCGKKSPP